MIDPHRWRQVQDIFHLALAETDAASRAEVVATACGDDAALRAEVEHLLRSHAAADAFLETPASGGLRLAERADDAVPIVEPPRPPDIGPYRIEREIGSGGMGTVYVGRRQDDGLDRQVALKVVRRGMDSEHVLRRFAIERKILAGLEHPGIARLYDSGTTDDGRPYFVMEYVDGHNLLSWCEANAVTIEDRLRLFRRVCAAVQYAHQNLVVHRDLKPSNILVTAGGDPRLLDFGIAKVLSPDASDGGVEATLGAVRLMTPEYASPEQVRGERVTTASDVYSLGAILYELLSGQRPYRLRSRAQPDVERAVLDDDPSPPSQSVAAEGPVPGGLTPARLRDRLRGDLDAVVLKALAKDPQRRYATAAELSDDLARHLEGRPVHAQPDRAIYRAAKFIRRHRLTVAAGVIAAVSLVAGLAVALWQTGVAHAERARAERRFADVRALANSLAFEVHDAIQFLPGTTAARQLIVMRALQYVDRLAAENPQDVELRRELAAAYYRLGDVQGNPLRPNLGDVEGALASYGKSLALMQGIVSESGNDADAARIGDLEFGIGALLRLRGDFAGARAAFVRAAERLEPLVEGPSPPADPRRRLVATYQRLAEIANSSREPDEARRLLAKAMPHAEAMVRAAPADSAARLNLSQIYREESDALRLRGQLPEALARIRDSRTILEKLIAEQPNATQFTMGLLFALYSEAVLLERTQDVPGAIATWSAQLAAARAMMARDPNDRSGVLAVAAALRALGDALGYYGRPDEGVKLLEEGRSLLLGVLTNDPANGYALDNLAAINATLGEARRRSADPAQRARACASFAEARRHWQTLESRNALPPASVDGLRRLESRFKECRGGT